MKNIKKIKLLLFISFFIFFLNLNTSLAFFEQNTGLKTTADKTGHSQQKIFNSASSIDSGIGFIISVGLSFIGVIFMVLLVYGGILWMTSTGNDQQIEKAKNIIIQSIIGLAIVLLAYVITFFVINAFSGQNLLD